MIKTEELSNPNSCLNRAKDDEVVFVLLGRDPAAPYTIRKWVQERLRQGKNTIADRQVKEALETANRMQFATYEVKLTYFKKSGKLYSEGSYQSKKKELNEVWEEVKSMLEAGNRPGLVDGTNEFYVLIDVPDHPNNHPKLLIP